MNSKYSVSQIVGEIKQTLEGNFRHIAVEGEVSNLSRSSTGHWYFTLSDRDSSMSGALFKMDAMRNPIMRTLKDGDKVICSGSVGVYGKRGTFQLIVKSIMPAGKGDLKEQFEQLKKRLAADGLFDLDIKKPIPELPKRIAVITAQKSAALSDFLNILKRRSIWLDVVVIPALVQGDTAPASLRKALHKAIKYSMDEEKKESGKHFDVIVLSRGGGSMEDLWAFNDEGLAWDIYNCPIPTISAVGHQVDFTICDFVSDLRCETPSAAAEVLSHRQTQLLEDLETSQRHLKNMGQLLLADKSKRVQNSHPRIILDKIWSKYNQMQRKLERCSLERRADELLRLPEFNMRLDDALNSMTTVVDNKNLENNTRLEKANELLRVLNPHNVLERGYSYVETEDGHVIADKKDFNKLNKEALLKLNFHNGSGLVSKVK
jgi:exodeoxyribonuclease VII large subunit